MQSAVDRSTVQPPRRAGTPIRAPPLVGIAKPNSIGKKQLRKARLKIALDGVQVGCEAARCPLGDECGVCSGSMWRRLYSEETSWATEKVTLANLTLGKKLLDKEATAMHPKSSVILRGKAVAVTTVPCGDPLFLFDTGEERVWVHEIEPS